MDNNQYKKEKHAQPYCPKCDEYLNQNSRFSLRVLTTSELKKFHIDDLNLIKDIILRNDGGILSCTRCSTLCFTESASSKYVQCRPHMFDLFRKNKYNQRLVTIRNIQKLNLERVNNEITRRKNVTQFRVDRNDLPKVPKHQPR